jgi:hypothetical protein
MEEQISSLLFFVLNYHKNRIFVEVKLRTKDDNRKTKFVKTFVFEVCVIFLNFYQHSRYRDIHTD